MEQLSSGDLENKTTKVEGTPATQKPSAIQILRLAEKEVLPRTGLSSVRDSIGISFSTMSLTLLSIIQGIAFVFLVDQYRNNGYDPKQILFFITTFLVIVGIWHAYYWLAAIARWTPLLYDSLLMFVMGATEIAVVCSIPRAEWLQYLGLLSLLAAVQYWYNARRLGPETWAPDAKDLGEHICRYKKERVWKFVLFGFALIGVRYLLEIRDLHWLKERLWIVALLALVMQLYSFWNHLKDQHETLRLIK
jgi:hypothetical protein